VHEGQREVEVGLAVSSQIHSLSKDGRRKYMSYQMASNKVMAIKKAKSTDSWGEGFDAGWNAALNEAQEEIIHQLEKRAQKGPVYDGHGREVSLMRWLSHRLNRMR
jgi:hypothetical protein